MCGFVGVIAWDEKYRVSRNTLAKMSARIAHRGPDGEGVYFSPDAEITPQRPQIALAHRRLAVLDPDPRANQPFTDKAGRWLVYNGEIYNFRELRAELSKLQPSYEWRTNCDTEVLLVAYDQWGEKCVEHFNGMFAFAIWDEPKKALFLARDRMGQKPLYWAVMRADGTTWGIRLNSADDEEPSSNPLPMGASAAMAPPLMAIGFASELPPLLLLPWVKPEIDRGALGCYLQWGYIADRRTIFTSIRKYAPAACSSVKHDSEWSSKYFAANLQVPDNTRPSLPARVDLTRLLVLQAVKRQVVSDVPIGCFLSGGMDSSIVVAAMRAALPADQPIFTFSAGFDDPQYDESQYATEVAAHLGTTHRQFVIRPDAASDLSVIARQFGEPFGDSSALPTYYLARETRQYVKVALSGDGGDELFGGYDRYYAMRMAAAFDFLPDAVRQAAASKVWQRLPGSHPKSRAARIRRFLESAKFSSPLERYLSIMELFSASRLQELLPAERQAGLRWWELSQKILGIRLMTHRDAVEMAAAIDRVSYLPFDLLTKVDRASMSHALEVRSPFMDHELVEFASSLTTAEMLNGGPKRMLREAFAQDLPAWVFKRKKMGFAVPIGDWFRGELRSMLRDHLFAADSFAAAHFNRPVIERLVEEHESFRNDHSQRLYALLMLELWWKNP